MEDSTPQNSQQIEQNEQSVKTTQTNAKKPGFIRKLLKNLSSFGLIITAVVLAWAMITFVFQTYVVDGQSMEPTLHDTDRLIVVKLGKTLSSIKGSDYIPPRYSVIVFTRHGTTDSSSSSEKQLIKRVIGLPGDRVIVREGRVTVINSEHPNGFEVDSSDDYSTSTKVTTGNVDITVSQGELFVLGDNRSNSLDSRNFGTVSSEDVVGELKLRILPLSSTRSF